MDRQIVLVAAVNKRGAIGKGNKLLWSIPSDLFHFKLLTLKGTVVMGRKTFESLGNKPLPDRRNIVMSQDMAYKPFGQEVCRSALALFEMTSETERIFVIGGEAIYRLFMPYAEGLVVSYVDAEVEGDTHFPEIDMARFKEIHRVVADKDLRDEYSYEIAYYVLR